MSKIRVLVVEDSPTVRHRIIEVLEADDELEIAGAAGDGKRAIELCREIRPDVITMDMMLPVMTGVAATEWIMAHCPTPILIVSASTNRGELFRTYDALAAGALDVLEKPTGNEADGEWEQKLVATVKLISRIRVITHPRARLGALGRRSGAEDVTPAPFRPAAKGIELVAVGASTGGPAAILEVLSGLPKDFRLPIIIVLHIGEPFGVAFADWLDAQTARRVVYATDGERVSSIGSRVTLAPPGSHLIVRDGRLRLTRDPERNFCRPSVDVLFETIAREYGAAAAGCLLTGMGRDGAAGLLEIRKTGGVTIVQDEATSVVYGMPREAVLLGAASHVAPIAEIAGLIAALPPARSER